MKVTLKLFLILCIFSIELINSNNRLLIRLEEDTHVYQHYFQQNIKKNTINFSEYVLSLSAKFVTVPLINFPLRKNKHIIPNIKPLISF